MGGTEKLFRLHLIISGRVQAVCFRHYTREEANLLGLKGFVRNLGDGRVEVVAEGAGHAVEQLLLWCYEGPSMAQVTDVKLQREEPTGQFKSFDITF